MGFGYAGRRRSVAGLEPGVGERPARRRQEPPPIAGRMEREPEDAEGVRVADLAVRRIRGEGRVRGTARPDHELPDAVSGVEYAAGRLRSKALVDVIVPAE